MIKNIVILVCCFIAIAATVSNCATASHLLQGTWHVDVSSSVASEQQNITETIWICVDNSTGKVQGAFGSASYPLGFFTLNMQSEMNIGNSYYSWSGVVYQVYQNNTGVLQISLQDETLLFSKTFFDESNGGSDTHVVLRATMETNEATLEQCLVSQDLHEETDTFNGYWIMDIPGIRVDDANRPFTATLATCIANNATSNVSSTTNTIVAVEQLFTGSFTYDDSQEHTDGFYSGKIVDKYRMIAIWYDEHIAVNGTFGSGALIALLKKGETQQAWYFKHDFGPFVYELNSIGNYTRLDNNVSVNNDQNKCVHFNSTAEE